MDDFIGWVGVEAERRARVSDGLQYLRVDSLALARQHEMHVVLSGARMT